MPLKFGFPVIGDIVQILSGVIDDLIVRNLRTNDPGVGPAIEIRETNPEDIFWFDSANLQRVAMGIASDELSWRINSGLPVQIQTASGDSFVVVADGVTMDPFTQPGDISFLTFELIRLIGVAGVQALTEGPITLESQTDDVTIDSGTLGTGDIIANPHNGAFIAPGVVKFQIKETSGASSNISSTLNLTGSAHFIDVSLPAGWASMDVIMLGVLNALATANTTHLFRGDILADIGGSPHSIGPQINNTVTNNRAANSPIPHWTFGLDTGVTATTTYGRRIADALNNGADVLNVSWLVAKVCTGVV